MKTNLTSATKAYNSLKNAIDAVTTSVDQSTQGFMALRTRLQHIGYDKRIEQDRLLYLKEIQNYTGYRITSFHDLKNT